MENDKRLLDREHSYSKIQKQRNVKKVQATRTKFEMKYRETERNLKLEKFHSNQFEERNLNIDNLSELERNNAHEVEKTVPEVVRQDELRNNQFEGRNLNSDNLFELERNNAHEVEKTVSEVVREYELRNENANVNPIVEKIYSVMIQDKKGGKDTVDNSASKEEEEDEEDSIIDSDDSSSEISSDELDEDVPNHQSSRWDSVLMFPSSKLTVKEVLEMLFGYFIQFSLGEKARLKLLELIKILAGPTFKNFNISNYTINKNLDPPKDKIVYHYYCDKCEKQIVFSSKKSEIKNQKKVCTNCESDIKISLSNPYYFLSIDFEYQLRLLLSNKEIEKFVYQKVSGNIEDTGDISDITDIQSSGLYRRTAAKFPNTITYNISTDGAPLSTGKSSARSFWPLTVIINDLPPKIRFKHVILVGIMIVSKEPKPDLMNLFIEQFKLQARLLHEIGMKFTFELDGIERIITFTALCIIADSVARAVLQCRMQYNSYCSCSYCYIIGFYLKSVKFPFVGSYCALRTHDSHMKDVKVAEKNGKAFNGVKGRSSFCDFPNIDMVLSFALDSMHNDVLGITEQMWDLIRTKLTVAQRAKVDLLLKKIQPPHEVHRVPEKLCKKSLWKATHWKAFMLYFSVPVLCEILPAELLHILEHYALFVNSMYTLSKTNITLEETQQCKEDMMMFTAYVEVIYGLCAMTFNVHLGSHAVLNVLESGPLWATSAFPYERNIFILKRAVKGPKGAEQQIAKKSLHRTLFKITRPRNEMQEVVRDFCDSCMTEKRFTASAISSNDVNFFAPCTTKDSSNDCQAFLRCTFNNTILTSVNYTRNNSFNDSVVKLQNGDIVQIIDICLKNDGSCSLNVNKLNLGVLTIGSVTMKHIFIILSSPLQPYTIPIVDVEGKIVVIDLGPKQYVCLMPNIWEAQ